VLSIDGAKVEYTKRDISVGLRPYGIDIASSGAFAAVANIGRGGTDLARVGEAAIGHWSQGAAFSPDGKHVFVGNMAEKDIQVLILDGATLKDIGVRIAVKGGPAAIRIADK